MNSVNILFFFFLIFVFSTFFCATCTPYKDLHSIYLCLKKSMSKNYLTFFGTLLPLLVTKTTRSNPKTPPFYRCHLTYNIEGIKGVLGNL
uniref:Putative secreted protein n=1 Tax=Panstrongylus lignarius TaxID=156445 RepID=A0A224XRT6_9HEMI